MIEQVPTELIPAWVQTCLGVVAGGAAVKWLSVILENRRLQTKDFRETLLGRIRELEATLGNMQKRMGNMREEIGSLRAENEQLHAQLKKKDE